MSLATKKPRRFGRRITRVSTFPQLAQEVRMEPAVRKPLLHYGLRDFIAALKLRKA